MGSIVCIIQYIGFTYRRTLKLNFTIVINTQQAKRRLLTHGHNANLTPNTLLQFVSLKMQLFYRVAHKYFLKPMNACRPRPTKLFLNLNRSARLPG